MSFVVIFSDGLVIPIKYASSIIEACNKAIESLDHHSYSDIVCCMKIN